MLRVGVLPILARCGRFWDSGHFFDNWEKLLLQVLALLASLLLLFGELGQPVLLFFDRQVYWVLPNELVVEHFQAELIQKEELLDILVGEE